MTSREIAEKWISAMPNVPTPEAVAADIEAALRAERRKVIDEAAKAVCLGCWSGDDEFVEWHRQERGCRYTDILKLKDGAQ